MQAPGSGSAVEWDELDKPKFFLVGTGAFLGIRAIFFPPFVIKTRLQVQDAKNPEYRSVRDAVSKIVRREGVRGLFRGFWISSASLITRQIYFGVYEYIRAKLGPETGMYKSLGPEGGEAMRNMAAGGVASVLNQVFTVPFDIVSQRLMVQTDRTPAVGGGTWKMIKTVYREAGVAGFYKGFGVSLIQFGPTSAIWWGAYGVYRRHVERLYPAEWQTARPQVVSALSAYCAACTSVFLTNPLDVVRTRIQVKSTHGGEATATFRSEFNKLLARDGPRGLLKGVVPRLFTFPPASIAIITTYEWIKLVSRKQS